MHNDRPPLPCRRRAGCWYAIQALAEAGALGAVVVTARKYSTDGDAILAAVQQVWGSAGRWASWRPGKKRSSWARPRGWREVAASAGRLVLQLRARALVLLGTRPGWPVGVPRREQRAARPWASPYQNAHMLSSLPTCTTVGR
jgi:hypothetical protein